MPLPDWSIGRLHTEAGEKINAEVAPKHVTVRNECSWYRKV
jgi:hypothetical protein